MKETILEAVKKHRIIAILRGVEPEKLEDTVRALYDGGIRLLEITFDQRSPSRLQETADAIRTALRCCGDDLLVGAGTVLTVEEVQAAAEAGAQALQGGPLTEFERLCDDGVMDYLRQARRVPFGEEPVIGYLCARQGEATAIRTVMSGRMAGLDGATIRSRLRRTYC